MWSMIKELIAMNSTPQIAIKVDPDRMRARQIAIIASNIECTCWHVRRALKDTLLDTLDHQRARCSPSGTVKGRDENQAQQKTEAHL